MFTFEIKINGALIGHIYGHNEGSTPRGDRYTYEYYEVEKRKVVNGEVIHRRELGIRPLLIAILSDIESP